MLLYKPQNIYVMNKEEFLSMAEKYYDEFAILPEASNFYDYEKNFVVCIKAQLTPYINAYISILGN